MRFLSPAWITAMDHAAAGAPLPAGAQPLVVQHVVREPDGTEVAAFAVVLASADGGVVEGHHANPSITFTSTRATAASIAEGRTSAQAEFIAGRLRVGGDVRVLLERGPELAGGDDPFAAVRAATDFSLPT